MSDWGVGMPAAIWLDVFGGHVEHAFGHVPYLVGSALASKSWRDVDVRLILPDDEFAAWGFGHPHHQNAKRTAMELAFAALGKHMTGLPIDFQIQQRTDANTRFAGRRNALIPAWRFGGRDSAAEQGETK